MMGSVHLQGQLTFWSHLYVEFPDRNTKTKKNDC